MKLSGKWPGVVRQYDRDAREIRVEILDLTEGGEEFPVAQIEYPIGDKSRHTEIRIIEGDEVWLEFQCGDPRYPIITGWRCPNVGNSTLYRRWHHENIESDADDTQKHTAGTTYTVNAGEHVVIEAGSSITLKVGGSTIVIDGSSITEKASKIDLN